MSVLMLKAISLSTAESPGIASLSSTAAGFRKVFSSSSASSLRRKAFPKARYRLPPMCYVGARRFAAPTLSRQGQNVQLLSDCHFQSRKDRYLPSHPQSVRLLPRPTGLPPMPFVHSFRLSCRRRENRPQTPQAKE